jgi:hypothetical protein
VLDFHKFDFSWFSTGTYTYPVTTLKNSPVIPPIDLIIVPQGAEHRAVMRGLRPFFSYPPVLPIPIGDLAAREKLGQWLQNHDSTSAPQVRILLTGLCGGLAPDLRVGDAVVCPHYLPLYGDRDLEHHCDQELSDWLSQKLQLRQVKALTSDRVISLAQEKQALGQLYKAEVVDMEGYGLLQLCHLSSTPAVALSVLRVISDDCYHDIPDLGSVIDAQGQLRWKRLPLCLGRRPVSTWHLIRGSLRGLKVLEQMILMLWSS